MRYCLFLTITCKLQFLIKICCTPETLWQHTGCRTLHLTDWAILAPNSNNNNNIIIIIIKCLNIFMKQLKTSVLQTSTSWLRNGAAGYVPRKLYGHTSFGVNVTMFPKYNIPSHCFKYAPEYNRDKKCTGSMEKRLVIFITLNYTTLITCNLHMIEIMKHENNCLHFKKKRERYCYLLQCTYRTQLWIVRLTESVFWVYLTISVIWIHIKTLIRLKTTRTWHSTFWQYIILAPLHFITNEYWCQIVTRYTVSKTIQIKLVLSLRLVHFTGLNIGVCSHSSKIISNPDGNALIEAHQLYSYNHQSHFKLLN
jgi:hypothetical protein